MTDYIKREDAENKLAKIVTGDNFKEIEEDTKKSVAKHFFADIPSADVRDDATAHKVVGGGERDGSTCWFECDNCGLAVDIGDVFCKHCGARFVP